MIYPSEYGFAAIKDILIEVYGERGRYENSLRRYMQSDEWIASCRDVKSIDQVPALTMDVIKQQIQWEAKMREKALALQSFVQNHSGALKEDDFCMLAAEMGLAPSPCPWVETLFPHVVDLWVSSEEEGQDIQKRVEDRKGQIAMIGNLMMDYLSDRQVVTYRQPGTNESRTFLSQGYVRNFFRGENAFYGQSRPSLYRGISANPQKAFLQRLTGLLKMSEFSLWINQLRCAHDSGVDPFHGAIAQHYGIPTNGIDITSDLKVALFFACCTYDSVGQGWRPLKVEEIQNADSRPDVARLGGDSRYGMIFFAPADTSFLSREVEDPTLHLACPTPIGYQPFMRCAAQSAYIIEAGEPYDLYHDGTFAKYKIRLTEEMCRWIYHEMHEGQDIYPKEGLNAFQPYIERIRSSTEYYEGALSLTLNFHKLGLSLEEAKKLLRQAGYRCVKELPWNSPQVLGEIDALYSHFENMTFQFTV